MKMSVVVPIYGCRAALPELHRRLAESVATVTEDFELIFVNDNCPQNSWEVIEEICKNDKRVKGIELSRNFGQMKAILAGLDYCTGDWVVVMDCDLQDRPEEIPRLYAKAMEGYDVVFARRVNRQDKKGKVFLANMFYKVYEFATDGSYDPALCNFGVIKKEVIDNYCKMREYHRSYVMYIKWLGYRQASLDVEHNERYEGKSGYSLKKRMNMALEILTSQSDKVLRWFVGLGFAMSFASLIALIVVIIHHIIHVINHEASTIGWTSLIATNVLIGGIIVMVVGVVGIYVGNIFMQTKGRPLYVVRQILNDEKEKDSDK